jgi:hypothetical protein
LIVENDLPVGGEGFKRLEIVVAGPRSAVEQQQGHASATDAAIPDTTAFN